MADVTIEVMAAELAELIYERWMSAAEAGLVVEHAAIEAQITLIDALQGAAEDRQASVLLLQAATQVLGEMQHFASPGELQLAVAARARLLAGPDAQRIAIPA